MACNKLFAIIVLVCCSSIANAQRDWQKMRASSSVYRRADSVANMMFTRAYGFRHSFLKPAMLKSPAANSLTSSCGYFCATGVVAATGLELTGIRVNDKTAKLSWKTIAEYACASFELQRSADDARNFTTVAAHACAGSPVNPADYERLDPNNFSGTTWYRVKQIDTDGSFIYSNVVAIQGLKAGPGVLMLPVPARFSEIRCKLSGFRLNEPLTITILSAQGQTVARKNVRAVNGDLRLSSLSNVLPSGNYLLLVQTPEIALKTGFTIIQ